MTASRRRIVRPAPPPSSTDQARVKKIRARLERERAALSRWQARLKRAFNTVQKNQARITRLERQLAQLGT